MEEIPLSLYLQLNQGTYAEADVASRATIEFVDMVKQVVAFLDPDADVNVELVSGSEGSLGVNTVARIKEVVAKAGETADLITAGLKARKVHWLAIYIVFRITNHSVDWAQDKVFDWLSGHDAPAAAKTLSDDDRRAIAADIVRMMRENIAKDPVRRIYRECDRDAKIEGLGVAERPREKPLVIVPKGQFSSFSGVTVESEGETRTVTERMGVTLVSPVLLPGDRRWRFRSSTGEFGAPVRDVRFMESILNGTIGIPLQAGVALDLDLETKEARQDGVWEIESRAVTKVHGWKAAPVQPDLLSPSP